MPDMIVQHVDGLLAERIKALARQRQCPVNDVLLEALRHGLGMSAAQQQSSESLRDRRSLRALDRVDAPVAHPPPRSSPEVGRR